MPIDLREIFWKIPVIPYAQPTNGVIKKQMKFNSTAQEELNYIQDKIKDEKYFEEHIITHIDNPTGRIKFKDIRKVSVGISKKDMSVKITIDEQIEHYTKLLNDLRNQKIKEIDDFVVKTKVTKNNKKQLVEPEPVSESESEDEIKEEKPTSAVTTAALKVKKLFEGF